MSIDFNKILNIRSVAEKSCVNNLGDNNPKIGAFGYGYKTTDIGFERSIPGLDAIITKYADVKPEVYTKNVAQLVIGDDYIPDGSVEDLAFCD